MEPAISTSLPPLHISQLNPLPAWEARADYGKRTLITFALRKHHEYEPCGKKNIKNWSIEIYRAKDKTHVKLGVQLGIEESAARDDESDSEEWTGSYEYLIFLFQKIDTVFVLSTSKAYKHIRNECSMRFSRICAAQLAHLFTRIQQVSTGQIFGPVSESTMNLSQAYPETVNQNGMISREFSAIVSNFKIKFKENGILVYKAVRLEAYTDFIADINHDQPILEWEIPGLPNSNLAQVKDSIQKDLNENICNYLVGLKVPNCTFCLRVSDRWHSNATAFRLSLERRRYGGALETIEFSLEECLISPDLAFLMEFLNKTTLLVEEIPLTDPKLDSLQKLNLEPILDKRVSIEYHTMNNQWYGQPLLDTIDGWIRTEEGDVYFKLGTLWYNIQKEYVDQVQKSLAQVIGQPGCVLGKGLPGYLFLPWEEVNETEYNRSYLKLKQENAWYDGNQKFRSRVEIFDILQITPDNEVFVYHVKKQFNTHIREAVSQLLMSAQLIFNSRNSEMMHLDSIQTRDYCTKVAGENDLRLFQALRTGKLHFVLAFQSNGVNDMLRSASLIAKSEVIRAKQEIEKLGFSFKISPIPTEWPSG